MAVLLLAEHDHRQLSPATLSVLAAATQLGCPIHLLVAGQDCLPVARAAACLAGVSKVLCAQAPYYAQPTSENMAVLLQQLSSQYSYVLLAATAHGKAILPRLAALLDMSPVSNVVRVINADTFERPIHAGNLLASVRCMEPIRLLSICPSAFKPIVRTQPAAEIVNVAVAEDLGLSRVEMQIDHTAQGNRPDLASARVVVSGGRGFETAEDFHRLLGPLADRLNAALGATRAIVDAGVKNNLQLGQSGISVAPDLYIAIGLSGAIQHTSGIKNSKCIVAINKDQHAPICQFADYVLIADLYEAIPALTAALEENIRSRDQ